MHQLRFERGEPNLHYNTIQSYIVSKIAFVSEIGHYFWTMFACAGQMWRILSSLPTISSKLLSNNLLNHFTRIKVSTQFHRCDTSNEQSMIVLRILHFHKSSKKKIRSSLSNFASCEVLVLRKTGLWLRNWIQLILFHVERYYIL